MYNHTPGYHVSKYRVRKHFPTRAKSDLYCRMTQPASHPARPFLSPSQAARARRRTARRQTTKRLWPAYQRLPAFVPVPVRARRDGWDAVRQGQFLGWLAQTGCVAEAAARVGRSRESAYRLRARADAGSFAAAWDAVLAIRAGKAGSMIPARKVTPDDLPALAFDGPVRVRMFRGRFAGVSRTPSDTALLRLIAQCNRAARGIDQGLCR